MDRVNASNMKLLIERNYVTFINLFTTSIYVLIKQLWTSLYVNMLWFYRTVKDNSNGNKRKTKAKQHTHANPQQINDSKNYPPPPQKKKTKKKPRDPQ